MDANIFRYKENAKERSKLLRDRPMKPLDTAVYWVEYIIRNGGSHFKSTAIDLFWYEKTMLDVLVFYLAVAWGFLYLLMVVLKRIFCTTRKHNTVKKTQ